MSYDSSNLIDESGRHPVGGPVINLSFNDRSSQLLYYHRAQTLYGSYQHLTTFDIHRNTSRVRFSSSLNLLFSISIPFFGTHRAISRDGSPMCNWRYLSFGIAKHREENWTVACLLKSEAFCRSHNCGHVLNLERGRRLQEWTIVGHLCGYQVPTSSLGGIIAASPHGTRIAMANWNIIYVWALEPNALIGENSDDFYRPTPRSENTGAVELQPIVLSLEAVCFKLRFLEDEDKLLALTDRGVMHWDISPLAKGEKTIYRWPYNGSLA